MKRGKKYPWQRWPTGRRSFRQNKPTASGSSLAGVRRRRGQDKPRLKYSNPRLLVRAELPLHVNFTDPVKEKCVDSVREKHGDKYAEAAAKALDALIPGAVRGASLTFTADTRFSWTTVKGSVAAEFTLNILAAAGVPLAELAPAPILHVKAAFDYDGNLETGTMTVANINVDVELEVA